MKILNKQVKICSSGEYLELYSNLKSIDFFMKK